MAGFRSCTNSRSIQIRESKLPAARRKIAGILGVFQDFSTRTAAIWAAKLGAEAIGTASYLSGGSWSVLWPGSTIPAVFPKTMKCLSVLHKLFAPLLLSALYSSGFSLLVQLLTIFPLQVVFFSVP